MSKPKNTDPSEYSRKIKNIGDYKREKDRLEYETQKKIILSSPRYIHEDIKLREVGILRIQILYFPSFESGYLWDVREQYRKNDQSFEVYENRLVNTSTIAPGYKKLDVDSKIVSDFIERMNLINVNLRLDNSHRHGMDGTLYGLNIYNDLQRRIKLTWWEMHPDLAVLDKGIKSMVEFFLNVENKVDVI